MSAHPLAFAPSAVPALLRPGGPHVPPDNPAYRAVPVEPSREPQKARPRGTAISFEFFPPKTDIGADKLAEVAHKLAAWQPHYVSITCGAGGSAIDGTFATARRLHEKAGLAVVPHMAISRQSRARMREALRDYQKLGVRGIVAVRGDAPPEAPEIAESDLYPDTIEFVNDLSANFRLDPIVAAYPDVHPRAQSPQQDLDHLKRKADAGAKIAITQFFFQTETFLRFRDKVRKAGIALPLVPGIMPIHNLTQVLKFANGCGSLVPQGFSTRFERHGDDAAAQFNEGVAHAAALCDDLRREGVREFHFYTLNRVEMTQAILEALGLNADRAAKN